MAGRQFLTSIHDLFFAFYAWYLKLLKYCFGIISVYTLLVFSIFCILWYSDNLIWLTLECTRFLNFSSTEKDAVSNFYTINAQVLFAFFGITLPIIVFILERKSGLSEVERQKIIKSLAPLGFLGLLSFIFSIRGILQPPDLIVNAYITLFLILSFAGGLMLLLSICAPHYLLNQPSVCKKKISGSIIEITDEDLKLTDEDSDLVSNKKARKIYIRYGDYNSNKKQRKFERQNNGAVVHLGKFIQGGAKIEINIENIIYDINLFRRDLELRVHWYPYKLNEYVIFVIFAVMPLVYFLIWMYLQGIVVGILAGATILILGTKPIYKFIIMKSKNRTE
jgi:hypothetical protein